ncbi:MAG: matrixin family metalloprotease [Proteobacteria bacterium]|nr:matrixin family metalloprotease [Pseudomonadota bacterium]
MSKTIKLPLLLGLVIAAASAQAAGPLIISDETGTLKPLVWDTGNGPIPVYTDGGPAFTFNFDGVTPFVTIDRANTITANAFAQWSQVPTSTFRAAIAGTIESQTGDADVTADNVANYIGVENGPGFWVIYDTDGSIMENFFGVDKYSVLGISSPEFGDGNGHITESWTVLNGYAVGISDNGGDGSDDPDVILRNGFEENRRGSEFAGVFTHEIGHAINLSHSQVNGPMAYQSYTFYPQYPGVPGCVSPLFSYYDYSADPAQMIDAAAIETMFPFIDPYGKGGEEQSSVNVSDDITGISNLYPTAAYLANTGTINGVLHLKDGTTPYSGINVIARNVANPLLDAVSDMTGSATQGLLGPDGRFSIRGLTPGAQYQVYIEAITSGGYPTAQQMMLSEGEYWNVGESADPVSDSACKVTPITAVAATAAQADITYNGYSDGVQLTPLVNAYMTSLSFDGTKAGGSTAGGNRAVYWDKVAGPQLLPVWLGTFNGNIDGPGAHMAVQVDPDGNGIKEPAIWSLNGHLDYLGDLNGNTCGGDSQTGKNSAVAMGMDKSALKVVGLAYRDNDHNGTCQGPGDVVPFIWDKTGGMRTLDYDPGQYWTRANAISGNGRVVVGTSNLQQAWAWVDEGLRIDLSAVTGAWDVNGVNYNGSVVAMNSMDMNTYRNTGVVQWDARTGSTDPSLFTNVDSLRFCVDMPYYDFFGDNQCLTMTAQEVYDQVGSVPVNVFGINDAGTVMVGRAGDFFTGTAGAIWVKDIGWMVINDFLKKQGVIEAANFSIDSPFAISGDSDTIIGGIAGLEFSWLIDLHQVYVCKNGASIATTFPDGLRTEVANGAQFGRCDFIN